MATLAIDPAAVSLESGSHDPTSGQYCAMELVSFVAGEKWSYRPKCTSSVISSFLVSMNDRLPDNERNILLPYLVECDETGQPVVENGMLKPGPVVGTNTGEADDETRSWMCMDWLVHEYFPCMLRLAGLTEHAENLKALVAVTSRSVYADMRPTVRAAIDAAYDKGTNWRERVRDAGAVAGAGAGAGAVAVAGAGAGAGAVAGAVIREAATAAVKAKGEGGDYWAQRSAAYAVFRPFYDRLYGDVTPGLRSSSLQLLDRMIAVGRESKAV